MLQSYWVGWFMLAELKVNLSYDKGWRCEVDWIQNEMNGALWIWVLSIIKSIVSKERKRWIGRICRVFVARVVVICLLLVAHFSDAGCSVVAINNLLSCTEEIKNTLVQKAYNNFSRRDLTLISIQTWLLHCR